MRRLRPPTRRQLISVAIAAVLYAGFYYLLRLRGDARAEAAVSAAALDMMAIALAFVPVLAVREWRQNGGGRH